MKKYFYFFCICIVIFSCKKEETPILIDFTENFTTPFIPPTDTLNCLPNQTITILAPNNFYLRPIFNPLNPNEIAFLQRPYNQSNFELWTFNFENGKKFKVTNKKISYMDWSIDNWIVFISGDNEIWKVKSNGMDLTKIPFNSSFTRIVKFSSDAKKIIFDRPASLSFGTDKIILDLESEETQILPDLEFKFIQEIDWKNNLLLYSIHLGIETYDLNTNLISKVDSFEVNSTIGNILSSKFTIDNDIFWLTENSIYKTNRISGERTLIKNFGPDVELGFMDVSLDKKTILVQKSDLMVINQCDLQKRNYLAFLNIDGSDERRILIPE